VTKKRRTSASCRTLELPGQNPLKDTHAALDGAVLAVYGFSAKKDLLQKLLDLNLEVAARIERGEPLTAPGIPTDFLNPKSLIDDSVLLATASDQQSSRHAPRAVTALSQQSRTRLLSVQQRHTCGIWDTQPAAIPMIRSGPPNFAGIRAPCITSSGHSRPPKENQNANLR
jgi:hypothetical protein